MQKKQQRMDRKLRTKKGRETYAKREGMFEPISGQIKQGRGFRQFLLRGLDKMRGEWLLVCLTHNILKMLINPHRSPEGARYKGLSRKPANNCPNQTSSPYDARDRSAIHVHLKADQTVPGLISRTGS